MLRITRPNTANDSTMNLRWHIYVYGVKGNKVMNEKYIVRSITQQI